MEIIEKDKNKLKFTEKIDISLANAIRRTINEIPILAIEECDIYRNDSALYDEIISHRLGLIPLKHQKVKKEETIDLKLKAIGKENGTYVMSEKLGEISVYPDIPIVLLDKNQEIEIVARAGIGRGIEHSKHSPGLLFYNHLPKIKISKEAESLKELAEFYPEVFIFDTRLRVKDPSKLQLDSDDLKDYKGIEISFDDTLVFQIESWGQISAKEILLESCKVLQSNLQELSKQIK